MAHLLVRLRVQFIENITLGLLLVLEIWSRYPVFSFCVLCLDLVRHLPLGCFGLSPRSVVCCKLVISLVCFRPKWCYCNYVILYFNKILSLSTKNKNHPWPSNVKMRFSQWKFGKISSYFQIANIPEFHICTFDMQQQHFAYGALRCIKNDTHLHG